MTSRPDSTTPALRGPRLARAALVRSARARAATLAAMLGVTLAGAAACRQDMHDAPRYEALEKSDFYRDHRSSRQLIEGTVARGQLRADDAFYTGKNGGTPLAELPLPLTKELVARGQDRYNVYCAPCHSQTGLGDGMVVRRGYKQPPSLHDARLMAQPVGYFYDVMTRGFGQMPDYAAQIAPKDRWAVAAYVRALQVSQRGTINDVPAAERSSLDAAHSAAPKGADAGQKEGTPAHE